MHEFITPIVVDIGFENGAYTVNEDSTTAEFCVILTGRIERDLSLNVIITPTVSSGKESNKFKLPKLYMFLFCIADYLPPSPAVVTFPAAILSNTMQQACFGVAIIDDTIVEATEEFILQLSTDDSQARLTTGSAVVSILDNDGEKEH